MKNLKRNNKILKRNIILIIGLVILLILIFTNDGLSHTEVKYKKISVSSGDTLWSLAKYEKNNNSYFTDDDVRDIIEVIKITNNLKSSELKIGDELNIPTI